MTRASLFCRILGILDRIQPNLRHIPDVTHTEIEVLRGPLERGYRRCAKRDKADRELLDECAKMLRRGQKACERQGWEKGESTEAWYHAAGQLAGRIEMEKKS